MNSHSIRETIFHIRTGIGILGMLCVLGMFNIIPAYAVSPGDNPNIDEASPITLTVHKHTAPAAQTDSGGKETTVPSGAKPVANVKFRWKKVDPTQINLMTNEGWVQAGKLAKAFQANHDLTALKKDNEPLKFSGSGEGATNDQGTVVFRFNSAGTKADSAVGLYLVEEIDASNATIEGKKAHLTPAQPFFVTLPMTETKDADRALKNWNYDVHVYPKNTPITIKKSVNDSGALYVGKQLNYKLDSDIPLRTGEKGQPLDKYVVLDKLNAEKMTVKEDTISVKTCTPGSNGGKMNCELVTKDADYTQTIENGLLRIAFTKDGLVKLGQVRDAAESDTGTVQPIVRVEFSAQVKKIDRAADSQSQTANLDNTAYLVPDNEHGEVLPPDPNNPDQPGDNNGKIPPIPSNKVTTKYAKLQLKKVDEDAKNLKGAEFTLYSCTRSEVEAGDYSSLAEIGNNDGAAKATSDAEGNVIFKEVRVSDFANNEKVEKTSEHYVTYCVKETKAPAGYELLPEPIIIDLLEDQVTAGVFNYSENVVNVKKNAGFKLPLTGSVAIVVLTVAAVLLIAGSFILLARRRRSMKE